jgi:hypothetical protein
VGALDDERADELLAADGVEIAAHHLRTMRRYRPHLLSEPEEKILTEKSQTGKGAWSRLFSELMAQVKVGDESLEIALSRLMSPDGTVRKETAEQITAALEPGLRTRAYIFNTLALDKSVDDRLRNYPSWISARNLSNEASDESVEALVAAVRGRYDLPQRWYRLKAKLLGIDKLADYDRMASLTQDDTRIGWAEGRELVLDSYGSFSPELGALAKQFFDDRWIDAPVRDGKRGGAFCAYTVPSAHPYLMLNWTARRRDVLTLAHEMGHGVHAALARPQGVFQQGTPLTLAETASVFGEQLVFGACSRRPTAESRLSLLAEAIEGQIATVFRQIAMNRFEHAMHTARREEGELASSASASCGRPRRRRCSATASRSPRATRPGGATSPTSSARPATSTRTPTGSCSRCRSTAATRRRARASSPPTSTSCAPAARRAPRSSGDRRRRPRRPGLLGRRAWTSSSASSRPPRRRPRRRAGSDRRRRVRGALLVPGRRRHRLAGRVPARRRGSRAGSSRATTRRWRERGLHVSGVAGAAAGTARRSTPSPPLPARRSCSPATRPTSTTPTRSRAPRPDRRAARLGPRDLAAELAPSLDAGDPWSAVVLREQRASPRDPRTGVTMLLAADAGPVELREAR